MEVRLLGPLQVVSDGLWPPALITVRTERAVDATGDHGRGNGLLAETAALAGQLGEPVVELAERLRLLETELSAAGARVGEPDGLTFSMAIHRGTTPTAPAPAAAAAGHSVLGTHWTRDGAGDPVRAGEAVPGLPGAWAAMTAFTGPRHRLSPANAAFPFPAVPAGLHAHPGGPL